MHNAGQIKICIPAIVASEKLLDGKQIPNYRLFKNYLARIGIKDAEELLPLGYWGICFWGHCLWAGDNAIALDYSIQKILFPTIEPEYVDFCKKRGLTSEVINQKWRNKKIDAQMLWCHIYHKSDIFLTRDKNFKLKTCELNSKLCKITIMTPIEFLSNFKKTPWPYPNNSQ